MLWKVNFDPRKVVKNYQLEHHTFYHILSQADGKKQLGNLIIEICTLLKNIADTGAMYGNLRTENIIIKMSRDNKKIEGVKFINFGHLIEIEEADAIAIPDQVDHLPPDMTSYL